MTLADVRMHVRILAREEHSLIQRNAIAVWPKYTRIHCTRTHAHNAAIVGGLLGPFTGVIGAKKSMFLADIVWIVSGLIAAFAPPGSSTGPAMLIAARLLNGVAVGVYSTPRTLPLPPPSRL